MTTAYPALTDATPGVLRPLIRARDWLDDRGRGAWLIAMILGFVFVWPVGLFLLAYMIWSKRMFSSCRTRIAPTRSLFTPTGNSAFDAYRAETLKRLEEEHGDFVAFLQKLREAKDKAEFDQFMQDRAKS